MALSTEQLRVAWGPPCSGTKVTVTLNGSGVVHVRAAIVDAVRALNAVLVRWGYRTRRADTGAYNCVSGDTLIITSEGWKPIKDAVGTQTILTGEVGHGGPGRWVDAEIRSFGPQELWAVEIGCNGHRRTIRATADHRWFARQRSGALAEYTTTELVPRNGDRGHRLASVKPQSVASRTIPSPEGVAAGFVFGDGTTNKQGAIAYMVGDKDAAMDRWFHPAHKRTRDGDTVRIGGLPFSWKTTVPFDEGVAVLYGWLAGYFAADGRIRVDGNCEISSAELWRLELAKRAALQLGIATTPITSVMRTGYGSEPTALFSLGLDARHLDESFFLIEHHRRRWRKPRKRMSDWSVLSVRPTGETEEVFCAIVPGTESFGIENFILTGNCRHIAGTTRYSLHAYGIALDINWQSNPMRRPLTTDMPAGMVAEIEGLRTNSGAQVWRWGGRFSTPDAMHFEIACAPSAIASGIRGDRPKPKPQQQVETGDDVTMALIRRIKTNGVYEIAGNSIRPLAGETLAYKERFARLVGKPLQILPVPEADWVAVTANLTDSRTGTRFDHRA